MAFPLSETCIPEGNVLMVDQLWIWTLDGKNIIKYFPKKETMASEDKQYQQGDKGKAALVLDASKLPHFRQLRVRTRSVQVFPYAPPAGHVADLTKTPTFELRMVGCHCNWTEISWFISLFT